MALASLIVGIVGVLVSGAAWLYSWRANKAASDAKNEAHALNERFDRFADPVSWSLNARAQGRESADIRITNDGPGTARAIKLVPVDSEMSLDGTSAWTQLAPGETASFTATPLSDSADRLVEIQWHDALGQKQTEDLTLPIWLPYL